MIWTGRIIFRVSLFCTLFPMGCRENRASPPRKTVSLRRESLPLVRNNATGFIMIEHIAVQRNFPTKNRKFFRSVQSRVHSKTAVHCTIIALSFWFPRQITTNLRIRTFQLPSEWGIHGVTRLSLRMTNFINLNQEARGAGWTNLDFSPSGLLVAVAWISKHWIWHKDRDCFDRRGSSDQLGELVYFQATSPSGNLWIFTESYAAQTTHSVIVSLWKSQRNKTMKLEKHWVDCRWCAYKRVLKWSVSWNFSVKLSDYTDISVWLSNVVSFSIH